VVLVIGAVSVGDLTDGMLGARFDYAFGGGLATVIFRCPQRERAARIWCLAGMTLGRIIGSGR
jgi:hypothetical protein